jgi:hypothetical protein
LVVDACFLLVDLRCFRVVSLCFRHQSLSSDASFSLRLMLAISSTHRCRSPCSISSTSPRGQ